METTEEIDMTLITYRITGDHQGKLRKSVKLACNFWSRFIQPVVPVIIHLDTLITEYESPIAVAGSPASQDGELHGSVKLNPKFLENHNETDIAGIIIHEIGHTLGFGGDKWRKLYKKKRGRFTKKSIRTVPALKEMLVELSYNYRPGTRLAHWDEKKHRNELMTGVHNGSEYILPVTIDVMELFGHKVIKRLDAKCQVKDIIDDLRDVTFSRTEDAVALNRDTFIKTDIWEEIPSYDRTPFT